MWLVWESPWGWGAPHRGVSGSLCKPVLPPLDWLINSTVSTHWQCFILLGGFGTQGDKAKQTLFPRHGWILCFCLWWWVGKGAAEDSRAGQYLLGWFVSTHTCLSYLWCVVMPSKVILPAGPSAQCSACRPCWCSPGLGTISLDEHACGEKFTSLGIKMHPKGISNLRAPLPVDPSHSSVEHMANPQLPSFMCQEGLTSNYFLSCHFPWRSFVLLQVFSIFAL